MNINNINNVNDKTKKIKKYNKNELWNIFDKEIKKDKNIECIYEKGRREVCENCENLLIYNDEGFQVCCNKNCGRIYKDIIDHTAEWRYYGADDNSNLDPTRCGMPINPLLEESSYGCKIICGSNSSYEMKKIRRYTDWQSMPYKEKSQYEEFQKIIILAQNAGIPKLIIDDAIIYHKKISETKTFRGFNRDGIIAATIYISSRINGYPRTAKEIANIFNLDTTSATKGCKNATIIINELEENIENNDKTEFCRTMPLAFIERYCSKLSINKELTLLSKFIATIIEKNDLIPENTPPSIAAGIIFYVSINCNLNISKKQINAISEISEVTINKCYKKLETIKYNLIPTKIFNKYNI